MNAHTLDTLYRRAFIRAVLSTVGFAVAMIVLLVSTGNANAQSVEQWQRANNACIGAQIDPDVNPACATRARLAKALAAKGFIQSAHGVWYTQAQRYEFANAALFAANGVSVGYTDASLRAAMRGLYSRLHASMTDVQMVAIYNDIGTELTQVNPTAAAFAHVLVQSISKVHADEHDPRYNVDEQ